MVTKGKLKIQLILILLVNSTYPRATQKERVSWSNKVTISASANVPPYLSLNYIDENDYVKESP
jgi:hypothetical protein